MEASGDPGSGDPGSGDPEDPNDPEEEVSSGGGKNVDFQLKDNGRPNLYVDYLGDNQVYLPNRAGDDPGNLPQWRAGASSVATLPIPGNYDQSIVSNPTGTGNTWEGYYSADGNPIFWIGIGVDRIQLWEALKGDKGISSFEAGFYYNNDYIEPYTGPDGDFVKVISEANIGDGAFPGNGWQWTNNYHIVHAETDIPVQMDLITQDVLKEPSLAAIANNSYNEDGVVNEGEVRPDWKMTYVSLETVGDSVSNNSLRLHDTYTGPEYDDDGNVIPVPGAEGDDGPVYLLYIPFKLKGYTDEKSKQLCLRLIRNGTHFSVGSGEGGEAQYAAWDRTTIRNASPLPLPDSEGWDVGDLKLQLRFTGDVNIFNGKKADIGEPDTRRETVYNAQLQWPGSGGAENIAYLRVKDDPSALKEDGVYSSAPVSVDTSMDRYPSIVNLQGGTGMEVDIFLQAGYMATVEVYYDENGTWGDPVACWVVLDNEEAGHKQYNFTMPEHHVIVWVNIQRKMEGDSRLYLVEVPQPYAEGYKVGNETTVVSVDTGGNETVILNSYDPRGYHPPNCKNHAQLGTTPSTLVAKGTPLVIRVETHADYMATVYIKNFMSGGKATVDSFSGTNVSANKGVITMPFGGELELQMPDSDAEIVVEYTKVEAHSALLEVWHEDCEAEDITSMNIAQMVYIAYDDEGGSSSAYSGQVYQKPIMKESDPTVIDKWDHSAVRDPSYKTRWVPRSAAAISKSLGGDTDRTGKAWLVPAPAVAGEEPDAVNGPAAIMSRLYSAGSQSTLADAITGMDLAGVTLWTTVESGKVKTFKGLRKNLAGDPFGEEDRTYAAGFLRDLKARLDYLQLTDPATYSFTKEVTASDSTVVYTYYDLTPAQVQAYLVQSLELDGIYRDNKAAYRTAYTRYQELLALWKEKAVPDSALEDATAPVMPSQPTTTAIHSGTKALMYQGTDYKTSYIADYMIYADEYESYINTVTSPVWDYAGTAAPTKPVLQSLEILAPAAAETVVKNAAAKYGWAADTTVPDPSATISTRTGRTVWLTLEADSRFQVQKVEVLDKETGDPVDAAYQPVESSSYQNVYTFVMPEKDCRVLVHYEYRPVRTVEWHVQGTDDLPDNFMQIEAYQSTMIPDGNDPPNFTYATTPTLVTQSTVTGNVDTGKKEIYDDIERVLTQSTVTLRFTYAEGYKARITITDGDGGDPIPYSGNLNDGLITFVCPKGDGANNVVIRITFYPEEQAPYNAHLRVLTYGGVSGDGRNSAVWNDNGLTDTSALSGTPLTGSIYLAAGWYIYSSYAVGATGSYAYTLSGDGYNNALGCVKDNPEGRPPVTVGTTMPNEELYIYIVVRKGIPPIEPVNTLTLIIVDDDNTGETPANNWIDAVVKKRDDPTQTRATLPKIGKGSTGGGATSTNYTGDSETGTAVMAGDIVTVDLNMASAEGYYVDAVDIAPSYLGTSMQWLGATTGANAGQLRFSMPAGSTTVTVHVSKKSGTQVIPTYFIYARRIETDANGVVINRPIGTETEMKSRNRVVSASSETIRTFSDSGVYPIRADSSNPVKVPDVVSGTGAGHAGETVTMRFQAEKGWYVQSVIVLTDGATRNADFTCVSGDNDGNGGVFEAQLVMPAGDARFTVNYRQCKMEGGKPVKPEVPEYTMLLRIIDSDNTGDPKDPNSVTASFSSSVGSHLGAHAPITVTSDNEDTVTAVRYIHASDRVRLDYSLAPGYAMDYMIVNPAGLGIIPTYHADGSASFTMPAENIAVIARVVKQKPHPYTANLILRPPAGKTVNQLSSIGQGTFTTTGGSLTDYPDNAIYSVLLNTGEAVDFTLFAFDGYYIQSVTVDPVVGVEGSLTGSFGLQTGSFIMPADNVNVNVQFAEGWPDTVGYDLTLRVYDFCSDPDNYAWVRSADGALLPAPHSNKVLANAGVHTIKDTVRDGQLVVVPMHNAAGFFADQTSISVTDSMGNAIDWWFTAVNVAAPGDPDQYAQAVAFRMPPRTTHVEISFLRTADEEVRPTRRATLFVENNVGLQSVISLTDGINTRYRDGEYLDNLKMGTLLTLSAKPATGFRATAYAIDTLTGQQILIPLPEPPAGQVNFTTVFPVPSVTVPDGVTDKGVYVFVKLEEVGSGVVAPAMKLVVSGPSGSGSADMEDDTTKVTAVAGDITQGGSVKTIRGPKGETLVVTLEPNEPGYEIRRLTVTDGMGDPVPYSWISRIQDPDFQPTKWYQDEGWYTNPKKQITFEMPATGGTVAVVYGPVSPEEANREYTAQIVVNDAAARTATPNQAKLWKDLVEIPAGSGDFYPDLKRLLTAKPGEWVNIDIKVQAGYRILPIVVTPQSYGIKPQLYLGDLDSQTTGFRMPAADVVVYVTFVRDGLQVYNAVLSVRGPAGTPPDTNWGTIHSPRTGTKGPITGDDSAVSVQAAAKREWVTVDYGWDEANYYVKSITVKDRSGNNVPFTQVNNYQLTLPMVERDVTITITYAEGTPPPVDIDDPPYPYSVPVVLHVIDSSTGAELSGDAAKAFAMLHYNSETPGDFTDDVYTVWNGQTPVNPGDPTDPAYIIDHAYKVPAAPIAAGETDADWGNISKIRVPAGKTVTLAAYSDSALPAYIESAYVLYREGGQMIWCNLQPNQKDNPPTGTDPGFYDLRTAQFEAHLGVNDVYVFVNTTAPETGKDEYTATLMLKAPVNDVGVAAISVEEDVQTAQRKATVRVNQSHGKVTATRGETIKITVTPVEGYVIDYILISPLGVPVPYKRVGNTYTFTMPAFNVCACVYLKKSTVKEFTAKVHYIQQGTAPAVHNRATITYSPADQDPISVSATPTVPDSDELIAPQGSSIALNVTLDAPYTILGAYVLKGGTLVPLTPALEGVTEVNSVTDNTQADGTAIFVMPDDDVNVFVVVTDDPPTGEWHVAAVMVNAPAPPDDYTDLLPWASITRDNSIDGGPNDLPAPRTVTVSSNDVPNHVLIPVREGQSLTVDAYNPDYYENSIFKLIEAQVKVSYNNDDYANDLAILSSSNFVPYRRYGHDAKDCNSLVYVPYELAESKKAPLTVVLEDKDNPGDQGIVNSVKASVVGDTSRPELTVSSYGPNGAFQVIPGVKQGDTVTFKAFPEPGYQVYAYFSYDGDPTQNAVVDLTDTGDGYTGSIRMPAGPATLTVTFYKTFSATLILEDRNLLDQSSQATLTAYFPMTSGFSGVIDSRTFGPQLVSAPADSNTTTIDGLGRGTKLSTKVMVGSESIIAAVLRSDATGTSFLTNFTTDDEGNPIYPYTMGRSDVTITVVVEGKDTIDPTRPKAYVAAVETVGRPAGDQWKPTITATAPVPDPMRCGDIWTSADRGATITVTAPIPTGYVITGRWRAQSGAIGAFTFGVDPGNPAQMIGTGIMPASNVEITLVYTKAPSLTLHIGESSAIAGKGGTDTAVTGGVATLTTNGATTSATQGDTITVTADPKKAPVLVGAGPETYTIYVKEISYQASNGFHSLYTDNGTNNDAVTVDFYMPAGSVDVNVLYAVRPTSGDIIPTDNYYTAWVTKTASSPEILDAPENTVYSIVNITHPTGYLTGTPGWACGAPGDEMRLTLSAGVDYTVVVTARRRNGGAVVPVIQQGYTGFCTASLFLPDGVDADDVLITVHYYGPDDEPPTVSDQNVTLVLRGHDGLAGNAARVMGVTNAEVGSGASVTYTGTVLSTDGQNGAHFDTGDITSPAYTNKNLENQAQANGGAEIRLSADWATSYKIVRVTLAVPKDDAPIPADPDPAVELDMDKYIETELDLNRYGSNAAARLNMPSDRAVITVYYEHIYTVTLNVIGTTHNTNGDVISTTDDRANTITSTGSEYIHATRDRLLEMEGGETVNTTAKVGAGSPNRLVGVVYESDLTGARGTQIPEVDPYHFTMPEADVNLYAVFEPEPDDPADRSFIAKVALDDESAPYGGGNTISIQNTTNTSAPKGQFWTAAKEGETVTVTVGLAPGCQAAVISAKMDDPAVAIAAGVDPDDDFHYYVNRTIFLTSGKTCEFQMPGGTDATITVKFIQGYDLTLKMTDITAEGGNRTETVAKEPGAGEYDAPTAALVGQSEPSAATGNITKVNVDASEEWAGEGSHKVTIRLNFLAGAGFIPMETHNYGSFRVYPQENLAIFAGYHGQYISDVLVGKTVVMEEHAENGFLLDITAKTVKDVPISSTPVANIPSQKTFIMPDDDVIITGTIQPDPSVDWMILTGFTSAVDTLSKSVAGTAFIYEEGKPGNCIEVDSGALLAVPAGTAMILEIRPNDGFYLDRFQGNAGGSTLDLIQAGTGPNGVIRYRFTADKTMSTPKIFWGTESETSSVLNVKVRYIDGVTAEDSFGQIRALRISNASYYTITGDTDIRGVTGDIRLTAVALAGYDISVEESPCVIPADSGAYIIRIPESSEETITVTVGKERPDRVANVSFDASASASVLRQVTVYPASGAAADGTVFTPGGAVSTITAPRGTRMVLEPRFAAVGRAMTVTVTTTSGKKVRVTTNEDGYHTFSLPSENVNVVIGTSEVNIPSERFTATLSSADNFVRYTGLDTKLYTDIAGESAAVTMTGPAFDDAALGSIAAGETVILEYTYDPLYIINLQIRGKISEKSINVRRTGDGKFSFTMPQEDVLVLFGSTDKTAHTVSATVTGTGSTGTGLTLSEDGLSNSVTLSVPGSPKGDISAQVGATVTLDFSTLPYPPRFEATRRDTGKAVEVTHTTGSQYTFTMPNEDVELSVIVDKTYSPHALTLRAEGALLAGSGLVGKAYPAGSDPAAAAVVNETTVSASAGSAMMGDSFYVEYTLPNPAGLYVETWMTVGSSSDRVSGVSVGGGRYLFTMPDDTATIHFSVDVPPPRDLQVELAGEMLQFLDHADVYATGTGYLSGVRLNSANSTDTLVGITSGGSVDVDIAPVLDCFDTELRLITAENPAGQIITSASRVKYTFTMPDENARLVIRAKKIDRIYTLNAYAVGAGLEGSGFLGKVARSDGYSETDGPAVSGAQPVFIGGMNPGDSIIAEAFAVDTDYVKVKLVTAGDPTGTYATKLANKTYAMTMPREDATVIFEVAPAPHTLTVRLVDPSGACQASVTVPGGSATATSSAPATLSNVMGGSSGSFTLTGSTLGLMQASGKLITRANPEGASVNVTSNAASFQMPNDDATLVIELEQVRFPLNFNFVKDTGVTTDNWGTLTLTDGETSTVYTVTQSSPTVILDAGKTYTVEFTSSLYAAASEQINMAGKFTMPGKSTNVTVNIVTKADYTLSVSAKSLTGSVESGVTGLSITAGSVTKDLNAGNSYTATFGAVTVGSQLTVGGTLRPGYRLEYAVDGGSRVRVTSLPFSFAMPNANASVAIQVVDESAIATHNVSLGLAGNMTSSATASVWRDNPNNAVTVSSTNLSDVFTNIPVGEEVHLSVNAPSSMSVEVRMSTDGADGELLTPDNEQIYAFVMPDSDVSLTVTVNRRTYNLTLKFVLEDRILGGQWGGVTVGMYGNPDVSAPISSETTIPGLESGTYYQILPVRSGDYRLTSSDVAFETAYSFQMPDEDTEATVHVWRTASPKILDVAAESDTTYLSQLTSLKVFVQNYESTVKLDVTPGSYGSIAPYAGETVILRGVVADGYKLTLRYKTGDDEFVPVPLINGAGSFEMPDDAIQLLVGVQVDGYTVSPSIEYTNNATKAGFTALTLEAAGKTVSLGEGSTLADVSEIRTGETVTLTFATKENYYANIELIGAGGVIEGQERAASPYTFTMPSGDVTLRITLVRDMWSVSVDNGAISHGGVLFYTEEEDTPVVSLSDIPAGTTVYAKLTVNTGAKVQFIGAADQNGSAVPGVSDMMGTYFNDQTLSFVMPSGQNITFLLSWTDDARVVTLSLPSEFCWGSITTFRAYREDEPDGVIALGPEEPAIDASTATLNAQPGDTIIIETEVTDEITPDILCKSTVGTNYYDVETLGGGRYSLQVPNVDVTFVFMCEAAPIYRLSLDIQKESGVDEDWGEITFTHKVTGRTYTVSAAQTALSLVSGHTYSVSNSVSSGYAAVCEGIDLLGDFTMPDGDTGAVVRIVTPKQQSITASVAALNGTPADAFTDLSFGPSGGEIRLDESNSYTATVSAVTTGEAVVLDGTLKTGHHLEYLTSAGERRMIGTLPYAISMPDHDDSITVLAVDDAAPTYTLEIRLTGEYGNAEVTAYPTVCQALGSKATPNSTTAVLTGLYDGSSVTYAVAANGNDIQPQLKLVTESTPDGTAIAASAGSFQMPGEDAVLIVNYPKTLCTVSVDYQYGSGVDSGWGHLIFTNKDDAADIVTISPAASPAEGTLKVGVTYTVSIPDAAAATYDVTSPDFTVGGEYTPEDDATLTVSVELRSASSSLYAPVPAAPAPKVAAPTGEGAVRLMALTAYSTDEGTVHGLENGLTVTTDIRTSEFKPEYTVLVEKKLEGTTVITAGPENNYAFNIESSNYIVSSMFRDSNRDDSLLAMVQTKGDNDINGNTADPINDVTPGLGYTTDTGAVWTTTAEGNTIDLSITVAKGYLARIKVVREDSRRDALGNALPESQWVWLDAAEAGFVLNPGGADESDPFDPGITEIVAQFHEDTSNPATGKDISYTQHFQFLMPTFLDAEGMPDEPDYVPAVLPTDVTVIVEFEYAGDIPAPYDPRNDEDKTPSFLEEGFIYGESFGQYAVVDVPTLKKGENFYHTDSYDKSNANTAKQTAVTYRFFVLDHTSGTYVMLDPDKEILVEPYDPTDVSIEDDPDTIIDETYNGTYTPGNLYNYVDGMNQTPRFDGDPTPTATEAYVGSKFKISARPQSGAPSAAYQAFVKMLDSDGSLAKVGGSYKNSLYIVAEDDLRQQSNYTELWLRPCFSVAGLVISYAPRHPLTGDLYTLKDAADLPENVGKTPADADWTAIDVGSIDHYDTTEPAFSGQIEPVAWGTDKWQQILRIRSSEMLGGYDKNYNPAQPMGDPTLPSPTFAMVLRKVSTVTYTRVDLQLARSNADMSYAYYNPDTHTFTIQDTIELATGDVDGDDAVKWQDQDMMMNYLFRSFPWSKMAEQPVIPDLPKLPIKPLPENYPGGSSDPDYTSDMADYTAAMAVYDAELNQYYKDLDDYKNRREEWEKYSVYNPLTEAYHCDLNGDGVLSVADWNVLLARGNYNHTAEDYRWDEVDGSTPIKVLPHGWVGPATPFGPVRLLSQTSHEIWTEGTASFDPVWDVPLTAEEAAALNGKPYDPSTPIAPSAGKPSSSGVPSDRFSDFVEEIPVGEEVEGALELPDETEVILDPVEELALQEEIPTEERPNGTDAVLPAREEWQEELPEE